MKTYLNLLIDNYRQKNRLIFQSKGPEKGVNTAEAPKDTFLTPDQLKPIIHSYLQEVNNKLSSLNLSEEDKGSSNYKRIQSLLEEIKGLDKDDDFERYKSLLESRLRMMIKNKNKSQNNSPKPDNNIGMELVKQLDALDNNFQKQLAALEKTPKSKNTVDVSEMDKIFKQGDENFEKQLQALKVNRNPTLGGNGNLPPEARKQDKGS